MGRKFQRKDMLLAFKAVGLSGDLPSSVKRVGIAILDHFNRNTYQCDPSLKRLAKLLGIQVRTVMRAIELLHDERLIEKVRHGGKSGRNQYEPNWLRIRELESQWVVRKRSLNRTNRDARVGQSGRLSGDGADYQTFPKNQSNQTLVSESSDDIPNGAAVRLSNNSSDTTTASVPAMRKIAAHRQWTNELLETFRKDPRFGQIVEGLTIAMSEAATEAELKEDGGGVKYICSQLSIDL